MFEDFYTVKRMKRFGVEILVIQKGNISIKYVNAEKYEKAYEKIYQIIKNYDSSEAISVDVSYVSDEFISFLFKRYDRVVPMNYSIESGYFEREDVVLKFAGYTKKDVLCAVKNVDGAGKSLLSKILLIPGGVGVILDSVNGKMLKIRR